MTEFLQLVVVGLSTGSAFALVGMSLVLVYRTTGIVNFAQGVFAVIGGLFTFQLSDELPLVLAMLASIVIAALASSILAVVAVGFRDRTTSLASTIITLGAAFLAQALLLLKFGDIPRSYPGVSDRAWNIGGVLVQPQYALIAGVAAAMRRGTDAVPALDDRRPGARRLLGLPARCGARRAEYPLARGRRFHRRRRALRTRGVAARAEQPDDLQLRRRDHGKRVRGGGLRRARVHPAGAPRRVCARDSRAVRGRLRRPAVQLDHRSDRHAPADRMAVTGRDRERLARGSCRGPARTCSVARAGSDRADPRGGDLRLLAPVPALDVRRCALRPHGAVRARDDRSHAPDGIRGADLARSGRVLPHRCVYVGDPHRRDRSRHPARGSRGGRVAAACRPRSADGRGGTRSGDRRSAAAAARPLPRVCDARAPPHRVLGSLRLGPLHRRSVRNHGDEAAHRPRA